MFFYVKELPVKQAVSPEFNYIPKGDIPLGEVAIISEHTTGSGADWRILGYNNQLFESPNGYMYVEGVDLMDELSENLTIYDCCYTGNDTKNKFIIKGVLEKRKDADGESLVLVAKDWEILSPISRGDFFRPFASKSHLSKWDFKSKASK